MSGLFTENTLEIINTPLPTWLFAVWVVGWYCLERRKEKEREDR